MAGLPTLLISFVLSVSGWRLRQPESGSFSSSYTEFYPYFINTNIICILARKRFKYTTLPSVWFSTKHTILNKFFKIKMSSSLKAQLLEYIAVTKNIREYFFFFLITKCVLRVWIFEIHLFPIFYMVLIIS